jgi:hypothetical protein
MPPLLTVCNQCGIKVVLSVRSHGQSRKVDRTEPGMTGSKRDEKELFSPKVPGEGCKCALELVSEIAAKKLSVPLAKGRAQPSPVSP